MNINNLRYHWEETFAMFSEEEEYGKIVYSNILGFYSEKHRHYHTLEHISFCLSELEEYNRASYIYCDSASLRVAIWLHDIIYDTTCSNNEERSVDFAKLILIGSKTFCYDIISEVSELILLTKHKKDTKLFDFGGKLLLDIDLSILGQDAETFNKYELAIRKEYSWVDELLFNEVRLRIVDDFLSRDKIYNISYFHNKYEKTARENLKNSRNILLAKIG